jgi:hypothetical protein
VTPLARNTVARINDRTLMRHASTVFPTASAMQDILPALSPFAKWRYSAIPGAAANEDQRHHRMV